MEAAFWAANAGSSIAFEYVGGRVGCPCNVSAEAGDGLATDRERGESNEDQDQQYFFEQIHVRFLD